MLRNDNNKLDLDVNEMMYANRAGAKKCRTLEEARQQYKKESCFHAKSEVEQLQDLERKNACKVQECLPIKKCKAKVGLHDGNGNFLFETELSIGRNRAGNRADPLPVFQNRSIIDLDKYYNQLSQDQEPIQTIVTKIAEHDLALYRNPYNWDGTPTGYTCFCPEKPKPCPTPNPCKKADPFNADLGIGSDALQVKSDLAEDIRAGSVEPVMVGEVKKLKQKVRTLAKATKMAGEQAMLRQREAMELNARQTAQTQREADFQRRLETADKDDRRSVTSTQPTLRADDHPDLDSIPVAREAQGSRAPRVSQAEKEAEARDFGRVLNPQERMAWRNSGKREQSLPPDVRAFLRDRRE